MAPSGRRPPFQFRVGLARNVEVLIKLSERRSKLIGLDAPERKEIAATLDAKPAELIAKIEAACVEQAKREAELLEGHST